MDMRQRILLVDDEPELRRMVASLLTGAGYEVLEAADCAQARAAMAARRPDAVLLDVMLPDGDGFSLLPELRRFGDVPVLYLSARDEDAARLQGLGLGADDYLRKPFGAAELRARVAAHLRRETRRARAAVVRMDGGLAINYTDRTVTFEGKLLAFAKKEFDIIELLSQNPGQVFDKERIYERVWGLDGTGDASLVAERVRRIRAGLAAAGAKPYIQTVWGCGYKWVE